MILILLKKHFRLITIIGYIILMLWMISLFYRDYHQAETLKKNAQTVITYIQEHNANVEVKNAKIDEHNKKVESQPKRQRMTIIKETRDLIIDKPKTQEQSGIDEDRSDPSVAEAKPKPTPMAVPNQEKQQHKVIIEEVEPKEKPLPKESKIEIDAGLVKIAMSNESSWMAIMKIIFTVLFTFFGIRLINFGFKRLEATPNPA